MTLYPKAVVLTNSHPYHSTEMMADAVAAALRLNGFNAVVLNVDRHSASSVFELLDYPDLRLVLTIGALPLQCKINGEWFWRALPDGVVVLPYVIDAWPYDYLRVEGMRAYMEERAEHPNRRLACDEANTAKLIDAVYLPIGAYPAPWRKVERKQRLMVWASIGGELARADLMLGHQLRDSSESWGLKAIADAEHVPVEEIIRPERLSETAALDSSLKRQRRIMVVQVLAGLPVDIYGRGWEPYIAGIDSFRQIIPSPDHNHLFGHLCQEYSGIVNIDPNLGHGTTERAVTALAMGVPLVTNDNQRMHKVGGANIYRFGNVENIRRQAEYVLDGERYHSIYHDMAVDRASLSWGAGVADMLEEIGPMADEVVPKGPMRSWRYDVHWNTKQVETIA